MRRLGLGDLREIVKDPAELAKGALIFDEGGLEHFARHGDKIYADARGAMAAPYKVQVALEERGARARCSCMAARTRPFCKHAAGLLIAWARAPESFAEADAPPVPDAPKRRSVRKGKVEAQELMGRGVEQVTTLVRELAVAGVAALADDREEQVRALGETLRDLRLRRLSGKTLVLAQHLALAAARTGAFDGNAYAELIADLLLTARKLEKHLAGEPLADEHIEELIGKTWTKKDRKPIAGLELVEYAFLTRRTGDDFQIRESRFLELRSGEHYAEKQILPGFLVKRTDPKPSWAGRRLVAAAGSLYPTFSPRRLDLAEPGERVPLDSDALSRMVDRAVPSVAAALAALQERRRDVFAPETLPIALRADTLVAEGARLQVVDATHAALFLPDEGDAAEGLARVLRGHRLAALLGDLALDGALPTIFPLAAVVERGDGFRLVALTAVDASVVLESKKIRVEAAQRSRGRATRWVEVARQVGASSAAIALGEVREEMADALAAGLATTVSRWAEPLAARLRDLSLTKQAELLLSLTARPDPAEKLDDFVKLHQVLGIALTRLAGTTPIDMGSLEVVPDYPSVRVRRVVTPRAPAEIAGSELNRYEAALHYARHYAALSPTALIDLTAWAEPAATPHIAAALAAHPDVAIPAAHAVLTADDPARPVVLTALAVLAAAGTDLARRVLTDFLAATEDPILAAHTRRALGLPESEAQARVRERLSSVVLHAASKDDRIRAIRDLIAGGHLDALPVLRASAAGDVSAQVRREAEKALGTGSPPKRRKKKPA